MIIRYAAYAVYDIQYIICTNDESSYDPPPATIVTDPEVIAPGPNRA